MSSQTTIRSRGLAPAGNPANHPKTHSTSHETRNDGTRRFHATMSTRPPSQRKASRIEPTGDLEKIGGVFVPLPAKPFTEMQTGVLYARQPLSSFEMDPATFRHANAHDRHPAYRAGPSEGSPLFMSVFVPEHPTATDRDCSPLRQPAGVRLSIMPAIRHPSPRLSSTRLPLGVERT